MLVAVIAPAVTFLALSIHTVPKPAALLMAMSPPPAANSRFWPLPVSGCVKLMLPLPVVLSSLIFPVSVRRLPKLMSPLLLVMLPAVDTAPTPLCVNPPANFKSAPVAIVSVPPLLMLKLPLLLVTSPLLMAILPPEISWRLLL